jgi:serine/threonine protein kinase
VSDLGPTVLADGRKLVGTLVLGRYLVKRVIGAGAKGTVYEARDNALGRDVALKVPTESTEDSVKRFLREGRAGASVAHPNVCAIYDFGPLEDGTPFLVMERLIGEPLNERLVRVRRMPPAETVSIVQQLLAGLDAAHTQGIVHRDLKPGNVFLGHGPSETLVVKVLDFGASTLAHDAARREDDFETLTKVGTAIGTPIYMSAEQVRGQTDLDQRVDVYACGVILYEAITGVPPFHAPKRRDLFHQILAGSFKPASAIEPSASPALDAVLAHALATERSARYPDAKTFAAALESLRQGGLGGLVVPRSAMPADTIRLVALQQRLEEVSSYYESTSALKAARPVATLEIPVDFEEEPVTERDPEDSTEADPGPVKS